MNDELFMDMELNSNPKIKLSVHRPDNIEELKSLEDFEKEVLSSFDGSFPWNENQRGAYKLIYSLAGKYNLIFGKVDIQFS